MKGSGKVTIRRARGGNTTRRTGASGGTRSTIDLFQVHDLDWLILVPRWPRAPFSKLPGLSRCQSPPMTRFEWSRNEVVQGSSFSHGASQPRCGWLLRLPTQGGSLGRPTLGFEAESRWDSGGSGTLREDAGGAKGTVHPSRSRAHETVGHLDLRFRRCGAAPGGRRQPSAGDDERLGGGWLK